MVHSLRILLSKADAKCIKEFAFAGMVLTPALVQICVDHLRVSQIEVLYGMTESEFITTGPVSDSTTLQENHDVTVGKPIPGCIARLYSADGQTILPRGVPGQLHVTGDRLASDYFTGHSEQFYEVDGRGWFNTGDQAVIDHGDQIFVVDRDKDIIVRGGENKSPARIEYVLSMLQELADVDTQIVGLANDTAGEAPVAVVEKEIILEEAQLFQSTVRTVLGNMYVPGDVISLPSLHVNDYRRTSSGKIIKGKLAELATKGSSSQPQEQRALTGEQITAAWASVLRVN
ncbi:uncharacterized protein LDX57_010380 [Aspergillus melleus]|uniref:uncharacterized protein n=1 Tax=Aspergillus melleus TaxID=138277 RepID=UPI001E8E7A13|nr:uncharacterized protein LDX57_010380 [Aspergillus melleus]KAH8432754.1 hypothetical protein LDX57_010380 [Aspergillus melleus]